MINDIREYYCNLTKLQKKKFLIKLNKIIDNTYWSYQKPNIIYIKNYLELYEKMKKTNKGNLYLFAELENLISNDLEEAQLLLDSNYQAFNKIFLPNYELKYEETDIYILDLFQRVLK